MRTDVFEGTHSLEGRADVVAVVTPHDRGGNGWAVALWLRTPNPSCGQRTPEEVLRAGEVETARAAAVRQAATWAEAQP